MIAIEPIQNFSGFGSGQAQGEYFYSQGMCRTQFGMTPGWVCTEQVNSNGLVDLNVINWFAANNTNTYGIDSSGILYSAPLSTTVWTKQYTPVSLTSNGNGMIVDQTNRVIFADQRYLNKWDGSTPNYTTGTVSLTAGSPNVVGTGTTFTAGMVGKQVFFTGTGDQTMYTVLSVTDTTHLMLTVNWAGSSSGSYSYAIFIGATERWKDFGSAFQTSGLRQMDLFEDWVVIANQNNIALLNVNDDSFNNQGLTLPSGYNVATLRASINGLLIGLNVNSRGAVFLWDAQANGSISNWIWFKGNVKAIIPTTEGGYYGGWYVITSRGIYSTNGYIVQPIYEMLPDDRLTYSNIVGNIQPNQVELIGNYLIFSGGSSFNRQRRGFYIFNLNTQTFEFSPVANNVQYNVTFGGIFYDSAFNLHVSYRTNTPSLTAISRLLNSLPATAYYITEPKGAMSSKTTSPSNEKNAEAAKFTILENPRPYGPQNTTYTIALKAYNFKRPLWNYAQTKTGTTDTLHITIDGTVYTGNQVGDEVTFLEGLNAGAARHITAIANQGTTSETWTLDVVLPNVPETGINVSVSPFLLVKVFSFSNAAQLRDVYFDIGSKYKGKRFLLKLLFTNMTNTELDITDGQFIYSDQGVLTS